MRLEWLMTNVGIAIWTREKKYIVSNHVRTMIEEKKQKMKLNERRDLSATRHYIKTSATTSSGYQGE